MKNYIKLAAIAGILLLPISAYAYKGHEYSKDAKISIEKARRLAVKEFSGKVIGEELEKEKGGSGLRYSFDIKKGKSVHEVGIDAVTGKVLENSVDDD